VPPTNSHCLNSLANNKQFVKSSLPGEAGDLAETSFSGILVASIRAERTPGAVAVSGVCGESGESLKTLPVSPKTNSKPGLSSLGFCISGAGPFEGCQGIGGGS
jgi:hypothetical protein